MTLKMDPLRSSLPARAPGPLPDRLVTKAYDDKMVGYLDRVGQMHTPKAGEKLVVPLVQMNALLGFVADALVNVILNLGLPREQKRKPCVPSCFGCKMT